MSILLEAVTRAKQEELGTDLDPVLTPRAQYDNFSKPKINTLTVSLMVIILSLLVVIVWLATSHLFSQGGSIEKVSNEALIPVDKPSEPLSRDSQLRASVEVNKSTSASGDNDIKLAGKVALPLAMALPPQPSVTENPYSKVALVHQASMQPEKVSAVQKTQRTASPRRDSASVDEEPIILGANTNQRGQDVLAALKYQVDTAASELGMNKVSSQPESAGQEQNKQYQNKNNLLAAFEAALKEVEIEKSIARPVTEPKLDPIPTPKADDLPKYGQLPAGLQLQVPEFNIIAHVYASDPNNRWLNVDGAELQQGGMIADKLEIIEIRPRDVVLAIEGTQFKVPAI